MRAGVVAGPRDPDRPAELVEVTAGVERPQLHRRLCAMSTMTYVGTVAAEPGTSFIGALSRAYRYAHRDGIAVAGTDLVLCALRFHAPAAGRNVPLPPPWGRVWRPVRYYRTGLDDPAPPPRARGAPRFDAVVAAAAERALRLAAYRGSERARVRPGKHRRRLPVFSPAVRHAVYEAIHEAGRAGVSRASPGHLLVALLSVPHSAAAQFITGWPGGDLSVVVAALRADDSYRQEPAVSAAHLPALLRFWRILPATRPRRLEVPWRALIWLADGVLVRRPYRRHGARYGHIIPLAVHSDIPEHTVRLGRPVISSAEVLLSILKLHEQLDRAGVALPAGIARYNQAGAVLQAHGVTLRAATRAATELPMRPDDAEDDLHSIDFRGWPPPRPRPGAPSYGRTALTALHAASAAARRAGHPFAGTTHLLIAVLADLNGPAARLLHRLGAPPQHIRSDAGDRLSGPGQPATP